jgi:filamentous hemagglutinin family protein
MHSRGRRSLSGQAAFGSKLNSVSVKVVTTPNARRRTLRAALLASVAGLWLLPAAASATPPGQTELPTGGQVTGGTAAISQSGAAMTVNQGSQKAIIQWNSFNIGSQAAVKFQQPNSSSIALNRVMSAAPSQIYGHMSANGQVFLINPSGITFGAGAQVNVGGLVASTLNIADQDFLNGTYKFTGGNSGGTIRNKGTITAAEGGYIGFLAPKIVNGGKLVTGHLGTVALAAGDQVTMNFDGDGGVSVQVDPGAVRTLIENHNLIAAPDGRVIMSAQAASVLVGGVINNSGVIEADSLASNGGVVTLEASNAITNTGAISASGATGGGTGNGGNIKLVSLGTTTVGGSLTARGGASGGNGGTIETSGHQVVYGGAFIDTRAPGGQTGNWLLDPYDLTVTNGGPSTIAGSGGAYTSGPGGSTVSNTDIDRALVTTNVTLQTGGTAGDGAGNGDIFVNGAISWNSGSSLTLNAFRNIDINANIAHSGTGGALAFNPDGGGAGGLLAVRYGSTVTLNPDAAFSISGTPYILISTPAELQAVANNVTGHYAVANDLDMSGVTFTPIGTDQTFFTGYIGAFSGVFEGLGHSIAHLTINQPTSAYAGLFGYLTGTVNDTHLQAESVTGNRDVGGLVGVNLGQVMNSSVQGTVIGGTGSGAYAIGGLVGCNCLGIQFGDAPAALGSIANSFSVTTVSAGDGVQQVAGFVGSNAGSITGSFTQGSVTVGANVSSIGGIAGDNAISYRQRPSVISGSFAQDTVTVGGAGTQIGGLVGNNFGGNISGSSAAATVTVGDNSTAVGGLVGSNNWQVITNFGGTIDSSSAIGTVRAGSGASAVGGLVGTNNTSVTNSYSLARVTVGDSSSAVGGLVGSNVVGNDDFGPARLVANSYALGPVTAGRNSSNIGGLVGLSDGTITGSTAYGSVAAGTGAQNVGGLIGQAASGSTITNSNAAGNVSAGRRSNAIGSLIGLLQSSGSTVTNSFGHGAVSAGPGSTNVGGQIGETQ